MGVLARPAERSSAEIDDGGAAKAAVAEYPPPLGGRGRRNHMALAKSDSGTTLPNSDS